MNGTDSSLSSTELFDPYMKRNEPGPQLEEKRLFAAAALLNNSVYICGGTPWWETSSYATCEWLNVSQATKIHSMQAKRSGLAMVAFENKLYAFGGKENTTVLSSVECYDPSKDFWTDVKAMSIA